jgi:hypothetical protein
MTRGATMLVALVVATAATTLGAPARVHADPAGPTDYRSEVTEVVPPTDAVTIGIVGGDSFVSISVDAGTEVVVLGYEAEPYLLIDTGGQVFENQRSPAASYNEARFGGTVPPDADPTADPVWQQVGTGGQWAWHDHRAHRMETFAPVNVTRGSPVLDAVVPLVVDGSRVDVHIMSTWMPAPSPWPGVLGALVAATMLAGLVRLLGIHLGLGAALTMAAVLALVAGAVQFRSLPAATGPRMLWWLAPLVALVCAAAAVVLARRARVVSDPSQILYGTAAAAIAAIQLIVWGAERRWGLVRAILPTDAPFWFDRFVTAVALTAGAAGLVVVGWAVVRWLTPAPARSPR